MVSLRAIGSFASDKNIPVASYLIYDPLKPVL